MSAGDRCTNDRQASTVAALAQLDLRILVDRAAPTQNEERHYEVTPLIRNTDVLLVNDGDPLYLCYWMRQSGLADLLPSLHETVWVGLSAGSMVMTPRIGEDFVGWKPPSGGDETLGMVGFSIFPHVDHPELPDNCMANAEKWAAERWLSRNAVHFGAAPVTLLGDDRYCHQPFCEHVLATGWHFVFTCKSTSHPALSLEVDLLTQAGGVAKLTEQHVVDGHPQVWRYRYATRVPRRADTQPLYVNWCEVTITTPAGELLYRNAWATDHPLTPTTFGTAEDTQRSVANPPGR